MAHILQTSQLTKTYQTGNGIIFHALRDVDLQVAPGEFVAVMGASGSGKSTLLHMLGGLDNPTSGEVYINDQQIDNLNERKRALMRRKQVGFIFQFFNLIDNLTVADNIEIPALTAGMSATRARQRSQELLEELGIAEKAQEIPVKLSGGQRQRVAIARALINDPAVLLADEPTGNLDSASTAEVLEILQRYHANGQTIFLVTHDARVASIADRVITMKDGRIKRESRMQDTPVQEDTLASMVQLGG